MDSRWRRNILMKKPGEGTKYQDRYLKEKGSPTRINHDEK